MSKVIDRIKEVARHEPTLAKAANRLLVVMAEKAVKERIDSVVSDVVASSQQHNPEQSKNPDQLAEQYVQRIRRARSVNQVRRLEAAALKEIRAARRSGRK